MRKALRKLSTRKPAAALQLEQLRETQGIMEDLRELPPGTVAIFTLVGEDIFGTLSSRMLDNASCEE